MLGEKALYMSKKKKKMLKLLQLELILPTVALLIMQSGYLEIRLNIEKKNILKVI